jgi:hypothetical protein
MVNHERQRAHHQRWQVQHVVCGDGGVRRGAGSTGAAPSARAAAKKVGQYGQRAAVAIHALLTALHAHHLPRGGSGGGRGARIAVVAVEPSSGDVLYDCFVDSPMRTELEVSALRQKWERNGEGSPRSLAHSCTPRSG